MKASDLLIEVLEVEEVEYIFGIPGEENLDFLESLRRSKKIQLILTRHEQGAGFMAATYGRLTGKPGVCLATLGPGATNLVTPAAYAYLGAMPMVMITGQKPIKSSKQGRFQIIDLVETFKPITKMAKQIVNASRIPSVTREAFRLAAEERPGPVLLELPEDIAREEVDSHPFEVYQVQRPSPDSRAVTLASKMIQEAKKPLLLLGAGANRKHTCDTISQFVQKTGIPFFNTQMGKGVLDERQEAFLGTAALSEHDYLHCAIARADLIINVGHDVVEKPPFFMEREGCKVIHLNFFSAAVDDVYFPQLDVVGDIATSIRLLAEQVEPQLHWDFSYFTRMKVDTDSHILERSDSNQFPLLPQKMVADVREAMPSDGIVALDNGMYKLWFARNYKAHEQNTLLLDNALATMGAGLPSAMAAKIVHPSRKVMAVCGDGGFMMNSQEIETAVRLNLDLVVLVLTDSGYGMIKWKQAGMGFENWGLEFDNPDFVAYANSYGANGHKIKSTSEFQSTLQECLNSKGVHLIDLPINYSESEKVLVEELQAKTCLL
ncbi:MAG: acetolactate synthase large subunit [Candidatus Obscuribacterales bacterium]|nr:acetolactate synthase large subunit [Candidatus Obscuribacterales bacterium]